MTDVSWFQDKGRIMYLQVPRADVESAARALAERGAAGGDAVTVWAWADDMDRNGPAQVVVTAGPGKAVESEVIPLEQVVGWYFGGWWVDA